MSDESTKIAAQRSSGLHNDFSQQEETMTNGAMPPAFALTASAAVDNRGDAKTAEAKPEKKATIQVDGVPEELVLILEHWEGIVYKSYPDNGEVSGGMGHLLATTEEKEKYPVGTAIPKSVVEAWARMDVGKAWSAAQEQAAELGVESHDFKVALGSMCFQNGVAWNTVHVGTWALMKEHKWEAAAEEAANSDWFEQTPDRVFEFQAALRKLADGQGSHFADPFRKKAAEAKELATKKQTTAKPSSESTTTKGAVKALPEGKEGMKEVQKKLKALGLYEGTIDGIAISKHGESNTTKGIKKFQESQGLPATGTVDATTWAALNGKKDDRSIWQKFMAGIEEQQKTETNKPTASKGKGLAEPFRKLAAEAKKKAVSEECGNDVAETGSFVDQKYWRTQQTAKKGGQAGFVSPYADDTACRYVSSEMLILYMQAEKPEILKELGVSGIGDLAFGTTKDVTDQSPDAGGFLRILQEDASQQTGGYEKNVQNPDAMVVNDQASDAIAYIDEKLSAGIPLVVGVDHTFNRGRNEQTTDHFVTLTGIGKTAEGKKSYYFFDPARSLQVNGAGNNGKNVLVEEAFGVYRAPEPTGSSDAQRYFLTTVIIFPADRKKFKTQNNG